MNDRQTTALVLGIFIAFLFWLNNTGRLPFIIMNIKGLGPTADIPAVGTGVYKTSLNGMSNPGTINNLNYTDMAAMGRLSVNG